MVLVSSSVGRAIDTTCVVRTAPHSQALSDSLLWHANAPAVASVLDSTEEFFDRSARSASVLNMRTSLVSVGICGI